MSTAKLPTTVKGLFPKENLVFAEGINEEDATVLKKVFKHHDCFERVGEMIDEVERESADLGNRMRAVLESNKARLEGLSPAAVDYSKKIIHFVTHVMCHLTLGKELCFDQADHLHKEFKDLSENDQQALKNNNPDISF